MRRRIYIDPEGPLSDESDSPHMWNTDDDDRVTVDICRTPVLRDDALWAEYTAAVENERALRRRVIEALHPEPWTDAEKALAARAKELLDGAGKYTREESDALEADALAYAKDVP